MTAMTKTSKGAAPLVSVLMPAHNAARYLAEAVRSVLSQSLSDLELIVVDDGSTDATAEVVASFVDPRLVYVRLESNQGVVIARNIAIERARGRYIALLDADDIAESDRLERQVAMLAAGQADICAAGHVVWNTVTGRKTLGRQYRRDADIKALLTVYSPLCNSTVTAVADVFKKYHYDERFKYAEDYELWVRLAQAGYRFAACEKPLVTYRVHPTQMSVTHGEALRSAFEQAREHYVVSLGLDREGLPRKLPWRERLRVGPSFVLRLNAGLGRVSLRVNYEIYARYQFRGNGWLTPLTRLERLFVAVLGCWGALLFKTRQ